MREENGNRYCCTRSGVGTVMSYAWLMDCGMCGQMLMSVLMKDV